MQYNLHFFKLRQVQYSIFLKNKISICLPKHALVYKMIHLFFFGGSGGSNAASIASSNTFFKPFCKVLKTMIVLCNM